ncbi:MAG: glycosylase [Phycisphaerae bacterium]|nr:glycosylase [Phycisphaerae bacterium]
MIDGRCRIAVGVVMLTAAIGQILAEESAGVVAGGRERKAGGDPLRSWTPCRENPVLTSGAAGSWDENIRERMWVLREGDTYHGWYAGWRGPYDKSRPKLAKLGHATSKDGLHWTKHPGNPIFADRWVEDICVVKDGDTYFMYAEDESENKTVLHLLTSKDRVRWTQRGNVLEKLDGSKWEGGWVGTPLVWKEGPKWFLLYEGGPPGDVALATSKDGVHWTRSERNPVLTEGKGWEDQVTAPDSIVKVGDVYHLFYHACGKRWQSGLATSRDLLTWTRYEGNPIAPHPSPVVVDAGDRYLLYTSSSTGTSGGIYVFVSPK